MKVNKIKYVIALFTLIIMTWSCVNQTTYKEEVDNYVAEYKIINNYEHLLSKLYKTKDLKFREENITRLFIHASQNPIEFENLLSGIDNHSTRDLLYYFKSTFGDSKNFSKFQKIILSHNDKKIGTKVENFKFANKEGDIINISDYEGKFIVIDFWATWCKPCLALESDYKRIVKMFSQENDIQFLSLAVRQPLEQWLNHINTEEYENLVHGIFKNKSDFQVPLGIFDLLSIPKFAFINKNQEIVYSNGPQPDSKYFEEIIRENINNK